jgi:hypothetical protein
MKSGNEYNFVSAFELVIAFTLKFPISVIDQDEYAWAAED